MFHLLKWTGIISIDGVQRVNALNYLTHFDIWIRNLVECITAFFYPSILHSYTFVIRNIFNCTYPQKIDFFSSNLVKRVICFSFSEPSHIEKTSKREIEHKSGKCSTKILFWSEAKVNWFGHKQRKNENEYDAKLCAYMQNVNFEFVRIQRILLQSIKRWHRLIAAN